MNPLGEKVTLAKQEFSVLNITGRPKANFPQLQGLRPFPSVRRQCCACGQALALSAAGVGMLKTQPPRRFPLLVAR